MGTGSRVVSPDIFAPSAGPEESPSGGILDNRTHGEQGSIQLPNGATHRNEEFDGDGGLTLYIGAVNIGAVNIEHRLLDLRFYQDLSNVSYADIAYIVHDPNKRNIFPVVLHRILSSEQFSDSIVWLPSGRSFAIIDIGKFLASASLAFFRTPDYDLFVRWMKAYGFQGAGFYNQEKTKMILFCHERFLRYMPWLAYTMAPSCAAPISSSESTTRS